VAAARLGASVAARVGQLDEVVAYLRAARVQETQAARAATTGLDDLRRQRAAAERRLSELRERLNRVQLDGAEAQIRLEALVESVRRDLDCEVEATRDAPCPPLPPAATAAGRLRDLERE